MRFTDAHESLEEPLTLPIRGKDYTIHPATAEDGLKLQEFLADMKALTVKSKAGESVEEDAVRFHDSLDELERISLGPARDDMIADGLPLRVIEVAGMTAFYWQAMSDGGETARAYWESGGKAPKPNRAQRRTATQTRQGAATTTQKPASRTGTKQKGAASKPKG